MIFDAWAVPGFVRLSVRTSFHICFSFSRNWLLALNFEKRNSYSRNNYVRIIGLRIIHRIQHSTHPCSLRTSLSVTRLKVYWVIPSYNQWRCEHYHVKPIEVNAYNSLEKNFRWHLISQHFSFNFRT